MGLSNATMSVLASGVLLVHMAPGLAKQNCDHGPLEGAVRSGLVTQVGRKPVLGDLIYLPTCGKSVGDMVIEARGHDPI